jgi:hypothetical protein
MRVFPIYADFSGGEIGPQSWGRVDLPFFHRGARRLENFIVYPQGGLTFRPGLEWVADADNHAAKSYLIPWEEPGIGTYFIECAVGKLKFYREDTGALVHTVSAGVPWTEAQLPDVMFDFDGARTMMFTHTAWKPLRLRHTGALDTDWTLDQPVISIANYTDTDLFAAAGHYPSACAFILGRLGLAGLDSAPNVVYLSKAWDPKTGSDRYLIFDLPAPAATTIADDDAFSFPISANRANRVYWLAAKDAALVAGTLAGEAIITGGDNGITAVNHFIRIATHHGSAPRKNVGGDDATLFIQKGRRKVRQIVWNQDAGQYIAQDLTYYAEHIGERNLLSLAMQQSPFTLIYAPRGDGQIAAMTYERSLGVAGWQRLVTDGEIESLAVATGSSEEDRIWVTVKRTINGATRRTIERFKTFRHYYRADGTCHLEDAFYVDCGKTFDNGTPRALSAITLSNPIRVTSAGHGLVEGDKVRLTGILGTTELNDTVYTVHAPTADDFALRDETDSFDIDGTGFCLTLDDSPAPAPFPDGATITGATSGTTAVVRSRESPTVYFGSALSDRAGFADGETIGDGTNARACAPGFPQLLLWFSDYISGGTITKVQKTLTGLTFLAGKEVAVIGDGGVQAQQTVSVAGEVTIADWANKIHVGLPYWGYIMLMPLEAGVQDGTAQGRKKRVEAITLRVTDSLGCLIGPDEDSLDPLPFRKGDFLMGSPAELVTGDIAVPYPGNFDTTGDIMIVQKEPLPLTITAVMPRMATYD